MYEVEQKAKDIKLALDYNFNEDDIEMVWWKFDLYVQDFITLSFVVLEFNHFRCLLSTRKYSTS